MGQALLQALEGFLVGAIPTIIFIFLLFVVYRALVHTPLQRVLHERYERTEGAVAKAQADIAAAAAKSSEYELRLREARQAVFKVQEAHRQKLAQSREAAVQARRPSTRIPHPGRRKQRQRRERNLPMQPMMQPDTNQASPKMKTRSSSSHHQ